MLPLETTLQVVENGTISPILFSELLAKSPKTLLYFYPKDDTPGCTLEGQDFTRLRDTFATYGIQVIGVSKDSEKDHRKFQEKCGIGLPLISDNGTLCEHFSVMGEKNLYGKIIFGLLRSTFLLDSTGKILQEWRSIRATGHAEKILRELEKMDIK